MEWGTGETDPLFAVAANLIGRGLLTLPSCYLEERLASALGLTGRDTSEAAERTGAYRYILSEEAEQEEVLGLVARVLAPVDPADSARARGAGGYLRLVGGTRQRG